MVQVINKELLGRIVAGELDEDPKEVKRRIEVIFKVISRELAKGNVVQVVGFGKFSVRKRKARVGRDPNTGNRLNLPETDTPVFSSSRNLSKKVKGRL